MRESAHHVYLVIQFPLYNPLRDDTTVEFSLVISAASLGFLATIVALHDSWLSEPLWAVFLTVYRFHHDHLRGPLWFHRMVNVVFNKTRWLRLSHAQGSVASRGARPLAKRHNMAWVLALCALTLGVISQIIGSE